MGTFYVQLGVSDDSGGPTHWIDAKVDTGAGLTVIPDSLLKKIGVAPEDHDRFRLADGTIRNLGVGRAWLHLEGKQKWSKIVFGPSGKCLLSAKTLQDFNLIADTTHKQLVPASLHLD